MSLRGRKREAKLGFFNPVGPSSSPKNAQDGQGWPVSGMLVQDLLLHCLGFMFITPSPGNRSCYHFQISKLVLDPFLWCPASDGGMD